MPEVETALVKVLLIPELPGFAVEFLASEKQIGERTEVIDLVLLQKRLVIAVHHGVLTADGEVEEKLVEDHEAQFRWESHDWKGGGRVRWQWRVLRWTRVLGHGSDSRICWRLHAGFGV